MLSMVGLFSMRLWDIQPKIQIITVYAKFRKKIIFKNPFIIYSIYLYIKR